MTTAQMALKSIKERVEQIKNNAEQRFPEAASIGDYFRQGDLYITKIETCDGLSQVPVNPQLAPGTSRGSRHILSHTSVRMFKRGDSPLDGPAFKCKSDVAVTHPEHGHVVLPPGCYHVTYQRAYAEELRRVQD